MSDEESSAENLESSGYIHLCDSTPDTKFEVSFPSTIGLDGDEVCLHVRYSPQGAAAKSALAVVWVLDFSSSMKGSRSADVKVLFRTWIESFDCEQQDIYCAVIRFHTHADLVAPFTKLDTDSVADLIDRVNRLSAEGTTYLSTAFPVLEQAEATFTASSHEALPRRLEFILTSDGRVRDREKTDQGIEELLRRIQAVRNRSAGAEGQVFTSCGIHTVAVDADEGAIAFLRDLTKSTSGTVSIRKKGEGSLQNLDFSKKTGLAKTLYVDIPEEAQDQVQLDLARVVHVPGDFTRYDKTLTEHHCEWDMSRDLSDSFRTFTLNFIFDQAGELVEGLHFATIKISTHGEYTAAKGEGDIFLELFVSRVEDGGPGINQAPPEVKATIKREVAKTKVEPTVDELKSDSSVETRTEVQRKLEDAATEAEDDPEALKVEELRTAIRLIDYGLRELERDIAESPNNEMANLIFEIFQAIDTMLIPRHIAEAIGIRCPDTGDLVPFPQGTNQTATNSAMRSITRQRTARRGVISMIAGRVSRLRRPSERLRAIESLASDLVSRRSFARRIKTQMRKREKCHCDEDCACGGHAGGCIGDCSCSRAEASHPQEVA